MFRRTGIRLVSKVKNISRLRLKLVKLHVIGGASSLGREIRSGFRSGPGSGGLCNAEMIAERYLGSIRDYMSSHEPMDVSQAL
jgi:hypothetical protein